MPVISIKSGCEAENVRGQPIGEPVSYPNEVFPEEDDKLIAFMNGIFLKQIDSYPKDNFVVVKTVDESDQANLQLYKLINPD